MNPLGKQQLESLVRNLRKEQRPLAANAVQAAVDRIEELERRIAELIKEIKSGDGGFIEDIIGRIFGGKRK